MTNFFSKENMKHASDEDIAHAKLLGRKICEVPFEAYEWDGGIYITKWPALEGDNFRPSNQEQK